MLDALPLDARAVAAAAALLALPGMLVVRSPWRAMPLLSLAFWVTSWTWLGSASRTRALHLFLTLFAALAVLRLLRLGPLPRAGPAQAWMAAASLLLAAAYALQTVPGGPRLPLEALTAELLTWRDGWPRSFEPLLPAHPFQASGLAMLAADVALLSGAPGYRTAFLVAVLAEAVLLLALWSLAAIRCPPARAAVVAAAGALAAAAAGPGPGLLAAAFAIEAVALWHDRRGHPSAFAAGACAAAAMATDTTTGLASLALAGAAFTPASPRVTPARAPSAVMASGRMRMAVATASVLAMPLLVRAPPIDWPDAAPLLGLVVVAILGTLAEARPPWWPHVALATLAAAAGAFALTAMAESPVTRDDLAALRWVRDHTRPLDLVCAPDGPAAKWIPAVAARPTNVPIRTGWPVAAGECAVRLALSSPAAPGGLPIGAPAFRAGAAAVWTTSQAR